MLMVIIMVVMIVIRDTFAIIAISLYTLLPYDYMNRNIESIKFLQLSHNSYALLRANTTSFND